LGYPQPEERTPYLVYLSTYNVDFGIGMAAYLLSKRTSPRGPLVWIVGGLLTLLLVVSLERRYGFTAFMGLSYGLCFGSIIVGSVIFERRWPITIPVFPFIGDASYSIYLAHEALASLFAKLLFRSYPIIESPRLAYVLIFSLTLVAGCAIHFFVERPLLRMTRQTLRALRRLPAGDPGFSRR
jgi:exopolysaccharide production protein ExoZ